MSYMKWSSTLRNFFQEVFPAVLFIFIVLKGLEVFLSKHPRLRGTLQVVIVVGGLFLVGMKLKDRFFVDINI